jgi:hypothetical protein
VAFLGLLLITMAMQRLEDLTTTFNHKPRRHDDHNVVRAVIGDPHRRRTVMVAIVFSVHNVQP